MQISTRLKSVPVFYLTDAEMEDYLKEHQLPNEWDYFDPAKADDKRECGLHAAWGAQSHYFQGELRWSEYMSTSAAILHRLDRSYGIESQRGCEVIISITCSTLNRKPST